MARYNGLIIPRSYNDYYSRSDPQAIRDIVALAADGELNAESKNPLQNQAIAKIVPATASPENKLIVQSQFSGLTADVETIKNIVPNTASETNELADKNFVNSTVGTNTANYIYKTESGGEKVPFSSVAELEAYAGTVTNNDYAFVTGIDENGNAYYDRYKADVNDGVVTWAKEYRLNNSSFTAEQWAAIQSGITAEKVAQFEGAVAPVDVVQSGNMSAVTSNSVYEALTNYINKTDAATLQQALQLPGVLSEAVAAGDNKAVKSRAVNTALAKEHYHFHKNTITYGLKIKIMEKISTKGRYFNALFSWSSYGTNNYISLYLLRLTATDITTQIRLQGNTPTDTAKFTIENDDLYFYPNGDTEVSGGGGAYNLLLS